MTDTQHSTDDKALYGPYPNSYNIPDFVFNADKEISEYILSLFIDCQPQYLIDTNT